MSSFTVQELVDLKPDRPNAMHLRGLFEQQDMSRIISTTAINRPGLALVGYFEQFADKRIQIIGRGENAYLVSTPEDDIHDNLKIWFNYDFPCFIFCNNAKPPEYFQRMAREAGIPILITPLDSSSLSIRLLRALDEIFAPTQTIHGVFVEVEGMGVLIQGESGIGKSETALELLDRGHRLIADDSVLIHCINGNSLWGKGVNKIMGHHMEIRGLGIIDIAKVYGMNSVTDRKQIEMVFQLEEWDKTKNYNRIGIIEETITLLDVNLPCLTLPIKPGRNIAIIIEVAVLDQRLKNQGIHTAREFNSKLMASLQSQGVEKNQE